MPDEQIIYLDPNDELTRVREKIEEVPARRIIMVVPQQTQLRSNVGWRLLHARARELGKEVQVISPDRQVRAVAKAAGFRTSQPHEGSSTGRTRVPPTQNSRGLPERRGMQRQRGPVNRGSVDNRVPRQRQPLPTPPPVIEELPPSPARPETLPPQSTWRQQENPPAPPEEEPASRQGQAEDYLPPIEEVDEEDAFDRPFEFRIDELQAHAARPLAAHPDEEEQVDPYIQDYDTARRIREAAQGTSNGISNPPAERQEPASAFPASHYSTPPEAQPANPFEDDIEEFSPVSLPEQRGSSFAPDVDDIAPDVADLPTDEHQIEFLDDQDLPGTAQDFPAQQWDNAFFNEPSESAPVPASDRRTRGRRSGKLQPRPDEEDEDFLPPADQPTLIRPNRPSPSGSLSTPRMGNRGAPLPVEPPPVRKVNTRPMAQRPPAPSRPLPRSRVPAAPVPRRQPKRASGGRGGRIATIVVVVLLLLLLIGIGLLYYGTSATVTITVPSKTISLNSVKLLASTQTQSKFPNSVTAQLLTYTTPATGSGTATGSTQQGNAKASGTVIFTNNSQQNVTIPSGTVLSTTAGAGSIQFVTTASPVIQPTNANNSPVPVPVEAQNVGSSGNVGANTITVIPAASITAIAQASNLSSSQINLSVTNPDGLTGGGAAQVATVTQNDLQNLKKSLHQQLQTQFKTWLQGQLHPKDIAGTPFPDVVANAQPLPEEQLTQVPAPGTPLSNKTFSGTLSAKISVLVVRYNSLVAATQSQLNAAAQGTKPGPYVLDMYTPVNLTKITSNASKDGSTINITLAASGLMMLEVNTQELSAYLTGKTVDQAYSAINNGDAGPKGVEYSKIVVSPSFLSIMPFRSEHIHINVMPGSALPKG